MNFIRRCLSAAAALLDPRRHRLARAANRPDQTPGSAPSGQSSGGMVANDQAARENDCSQARSQLAQQQNTPLGLLLGGTAFVLILLVTLLALASIERNERAMSRLLAEKGSSLIMAFESMLRTSMRGEARVRLQILLKEMASTSDVQFIAVTMPDGTILAHSNGNRLGEILRINGEEADEKTMKLLAPGSQTRSAILNMEGQRVFVVYRYFMQPPPGQELPPGLPQPVIFLGLDLSPFEITRGQDRDHVFMLAGVAMLVGLACLLALYYAQRARESRRRQRRRGEIRRLEEEIRRKEKLAAVGTLAAGWPTRSATRSVPSRGYATYFGMRFPKAAKTARPRASWCAKWNASTASSASSSGSRVPVTCGPWPPRWKTAWPMCCASSPRMPKNAASGW